MQVAKAFSQARAMGLTVCRTWAFYDGVGWHSLHKAPGQFDEAVFQVKNAVLGMLQAFAPVTVIVTVK